MRGDPRRLLGGYATDSLTDDERRELLRAALDDQALFDAILEEEGLRELLESPEARQQLLDAVGRPNRWERVRGWFARPATFGDLAAVATAVLVAVAGYQMFLAEPPRAERPAASQPARRPVSPEVLARLFDLAPRETAAAGVELEGATGGEPRARPGEALPVRLSLPAPSQVLLLAERGDGSVAQVYPTAGLAPTRVEGPPGEESAVRHVRLPTPREPGVYRARLVVAPVDLDLAALSPAQLDREADRLTLIDLTYEVTAP